MKKIKFSSEILTFFSAFCFVGAWIEYILPKPLPFLRLGLANFPLIIAAILLRPGPFFILALTKIFCQCLSGGTFFSHIFVFSLCSTLTSATIMFILANLFYPKMISMSGLSVAGALGTNLMQAMLAKIFFGFNFFAVAVPLIGMGAVTSVILGIFADFFFRNSRVAKMLQEDRFELPLLRPIVEESALKPKIFFTILGFILLLAIIFVKNTVFIAGIFVLVLVLNICSGIKVSWKITVFFALSIVVFNLFSPIGKVLLAVGNYPRGFDGWNKKGLANTGNDFYFSVDFQKQCVSPRQIHRFF